MDNLHVTEELELYLVENGLKPSALIYARNFDVEGFEKTDADEFGKQLEDKGILYYKALEQDFHIPFYIAKNQKNLDDLLSAETEKQKGIALGYPEEAAESYLKTIDNQRRDAQYVSDCFEKAKNKGIEIPLWLAYISHIPEQVDFADGNVSESSRELGERYQNFVRKNNPELAEKVEEHFLSRVVGWEGFSEDELVSWKMLDSDWVEINPIITPEDYDWAVMDTMSGELEFLSNEEYDKRCADENYDNTHFPISRIVFEEYGVRDVFNKKPDISGLIPLVNSFAEEYRKTGDEELKKVLDRWYAELDEDFGIDNI